MAGKKLSSGTAHKVPNDIRERVINDQKAYAAWESLTPLARNEWICWTISVKTAETRKQHIDRMISELKEGKRRPCCWYGCIHRKDKQVSPSVQNIVLGKRLKEALKGLK